jgi:urocanate hydratase
MLTLQKLGSVVFEFGNGLRAAAIEAGVGDAAQMASAQTEYLDPLLRDGRAPLLWMVLSGEASDMRRLDDSLLQEFAGDESLAQWLRLMKRRGRFEGLPARVCWLSAQQRVRVGEMANDLVARGELKVPIALGCDLDPADATLPALGDSAASTLLDALASSLPGASLVALPTNGHAESSPRARVMLLADGAPATAVRIERLLSIPARPSEPHSG